MDNRIIDKAKLIIRKIWHVTPIYRRKKQVEEFRLINEWHRVNPQIGGGGVQN